MKEKRILLSHGSGGELSHELIREFFLERLKNPHLLPLEDSAVLEFKGIKIAYTTDGYVVDPLFFPGGDIGKLGVFGTVNDLAMKGAKPLYLSLSLIIEEGFPLEELEKIIGSVKEASEEAGVKIVCGDTKVVNRGKADKVFLVTSGVGLVPPGVALSPSRIKPRDRIVISGSVGDHEIAILLSRESLGIEGNFFSDCAPLSNLVEEILEKEGERIHSLRDITRGGLATILNEIVEGKEFGIEIEEEAIPVRKEVRVVSELLGFDPLYLACEGKMVVFVEEGREEGVVKILRKRKYGKLSAIIGKIIEEPAGKVVLKTRVGGRRILPMLRGEQLPRIC